MPDDITTPDSEIQKALKGALEPHFERYETYVCKDAKSFEGNIACVKKSDDGTIVKNQDWDDDRMAKQKKVFDAINSQDDYSQQLEAYSSGAALGSAQGYTRESLRNMAFNIDGAESAVCTTFAVASASRLHHLIEKGELPEDTRIEIFARSAGHGGTHCFVVVNRAPGSDDQNPDTWGPQAVIVDAWLASLQNPSVYNPSEFKLTGLFQGTLERNYDSSNPHLHKEKEEALKSQKEIREKLRFLIKRNKLQLLQDIWSDYSSMNPEYSFGTISLGKGGEDMLSFALKENKPRIFFWLWDTMKDQEGYIQSKEVSILDAALELGNINALTKLEKLGFDITTRKANPLFIERALSMAVRTGNTELFDYIFQKELQKKDIDEHFIMALTKIHDFKHTQGLLLAPYLYLIPDNILDDMIEIQQTLKANYLDFKHELQNIEDELLKKYPHAFDEEKEPELKATKPQSPLAIDAQNTPPPMPSANLMMTKVQPKEKTDKENFHTDKQKRKKALQKKYQDKRNTSITSPMIQNLDSHIAQSQTNVDQLEQFREHRKKAVKETDIINQQIGLVISFEIEDLVAPLTKQAQEIYDKARGEFLSISEELSEKMIHILDQKMQLKIHIEQLLKHECQYVSDPGVISQFKDFDANSFFKELNAIEEQLEVLFDLDVSIHNKQPISSMSNQLAIDNVLLLEAIDAKPPAIILNQLIDTAIRHYPQSTALESVDLNLIDINRVQNQEDSQRLLQNLALLAYNTKNKDLLKTLLMKTNLDLSYPIEGRDMWEFLPSNLASTPAQGLFSSFFYKPEKTLDDRLLEHFKAKLEELEGKIGQLDLELMEIQETLDGLRLSDKEQAIEFADTALNKIPLDTLGEQIKFLSNPCLLEHESLAPRIQQLNQAFEARTQEFEHAQNTLIDKKSKFGKRFVIDD